MTSGTPQKGPIFVFYEQSRQLECMQLKAVYQTSMYVYPKINLSNIAVT